jgi:hypothetical protein
VTSTLALIEAAVREIDAGAEDSFGTFEVAGAAERWLQYLPGNINAAYPFSDPPETILTLPYDDMIEWQPGNFLAVILNRPPEATAAWIDRYFREMLGCGPDYRLTWLREQ